MGSVLLAVGAVALVWFLAWYRGYASGYRSGCKRMIVACFDQRRLAADGRVWLRVNEEASKTWSDSGELSQEACDD